MMRIIICFLGTDAGFCRYRWPGEEVIYEGNLFIQALHKRETFNKMLVFSTDGAKINHYIIDELKDKDKRIQIVPIPDGRNSSEIWSIFEKIINNVEVGDDLVFDITHSFRSLPFLTFLFAAYLRTAKKATISAVYYGASQMKDNKNVAPVLELSEFVRMLDWTTAADQFIQTGDGRRLAALLEKHSEPSKSAAKLLEDVSLAAALNQPFLLSKLARDVGSKLNEATKEFKDSSTPFSVITQQIEKQYSELALPEQPDDGQILEMQKSLIDYYFNHQLWAQAITLTREWMVDVILIRLGEPISSKKRGNVGRALNQLTNNIPDGQLSPEGQKIKQWADYPEIAKFMVSLWKLRNLIDHAEHLEGITNLRNQDQAINKQVNVLEKLVEDIRVSWNENKEKWLPKSDDHMAQS